MCDLGVDGALLLRCTETSKKITESIKTIRSEINEQGDATPLAANLISDLKVLSSHFFELYFRVKRDQPQDHA
jgi:hypothetical protein